MVDACIFLEETMRGLVPIAGYGVSLIVAGAYERFGTEEQKAGDPRRDHARAGRGDRDVRARGRARTSATSPARAERQNGGFVLNGQKTWISAAHIADHILRHRPLRHARAPSTRA